MYDILTFINNIVLILFMIGFATQLIFIVFFFLPARKYKDTNKKHRVGILICARNEEKVIGDLIKSLHKQDYPKESFDIFVVADNSTDRTAEIARSLGATVFERFDDDKKHHRVAYALRFGFKHILDLGKSYDFFIRFDADNIVDPSYLNEMNKAYASGAMLAKGYNNAKNLNDNVIATISGLWYIRDNRFSCHVRGAFRMTQILTGPGMMIASSIIKENGGWIHMGISEDVDFTLGELLKGYKAYYVPNAVFYDDQPSTLKDTFRRNMRMGRGLIFTFFRYGIPCLFKFFTTGKIYYLDMFLTEFFIPMALIGILWFPFYYTYNITYQFGLSYDAGINALLNLGMILLFAFIIPFILQALLVWILERKRIVAKSSSIIKGILLFPLFMIFYALGISLGIIFKPQWKAIKRSDVKLDDLIK